MTQDFKDLTLKYITNNIVPGVDNDNAFRDNQEVTDNLQQELTDAIGYTPSTHKILTTTTTSNYLMYGQYAIGYDYYGYIAVLNENGIIQKVFTEYDSGTKLTPEMELNYDENGNIYGVDFLNNKARVILLNNVALNSSRGYFLKLRASYYINYNIYFHFSAYEGTCSIKKVPGEATYFIFGQQTGTNKEVLIKFINNVGMPNEWYYYENDVNPQWIYGMDFIIEKVGDTNVVDIYYEYQNIAVDSKNYLKHLYYNGETLTTINQYNTPNNIPILDLRIIDKNNVYVSSRRVENNNAILSLLKFTYEAFILINETALNILTPSYSLNYQNGILFGKIVGMDNNSKSNYLCIAYKDTFTKSPIYVQEPNGYMYTGCEVQNTFSLYKFIIFTDTKCLHPSIVIYDGYSGTAKEDYNSVSASRGELYSNNYIMFARQLYNKQVINNRTISTLEIPNNYLNNITIDKKNLLSYSNNLLVSDTNEVSKNIYEQLFLNFNNTINVIDEDTDTLYPGTASYINESINVGTEENCNSSSVGTVRINYANSYLVQNITWNYVADHYETSFVVDASVDDVSSIDFMSNDLSTVYLTKDISLSNGYYSVSQKLRIE